MDDNYYDYNTVRLMDDYDDCEYAGLMAYDYDYDDSMDCDHSYCDVAAK